MLVDFRKRYRNTITKAEVRYLKFHELRHTFATMFLKSGNTIAELQIILGHANIETTMRYNHLADEQKHLNNAINKLKFKQCEAVTV